MIQQEEPRADTGFSFDENVFRASRLASDFKALFHDDLIAKDIFPGENDNLASVNSEVDCRRDILRRGCLRIVGLRGSFISN